MFGSRSPQFTDSQGPVHCYHSVAMGMIDREVGTVALLLFQDRGVGTLMDMGTLGVVDLSRLEHNLLKETRCFPQVDEVPEPLQAV